MITLIVGVIDTAVVLLIVILCGVGLKYLIDIWENKK